MGRKSVIVWGAFSGKEHLNLVQCETRMNSDKYIELVEKQYYPIIRDKYDNLCLFQQDNAPIHALHKTKTFMFQAGIAAIKW